MNIYANSDFRICIISHLRPQNVTKMQALLFPSTCHWYVGKGEKDSYTLAGAHTVSDSGGLCESRNAALFDADFYGKFCVQLSDDLKKMMWQPANGGLLVEWDFGSILRRFSVGFHDDRGLHLQGIAPTSNPYFVHKKFTTDGFIIGDCIAVRQHSGIRFDETLKLKEDYDFTIQHLEKYGRVLRHNDILCEFAHYTNAGGAVAVRTMEVEQASIKRLKEKWPLFIKDNPKRPNEILLRWKKKNAGPKFLKKVFP